MKLNSVVVSCALAGLVSLTSAQAFTPPEHWTQAQAPFRLHGNSYYVGTRGLSALLVTSDAGHVLIDGPLPQNAAQIAQSIRALGFRIEDVAVIVNSHAHSDHAGAIQELQQLSGARVVSSPEGAASLRRGRNASNDPQFGLKDSFPPVQNVDSIADGEVLSVGSAKLRAHYSPGHTPGGMSWTWQSCEGDRCLNLVYADSLTAYSDDTFRFSGDDRSPSALNDFRRTLERVSKLPCDVLIVPHPEAVTLWARLERREQGDADALIDRGACEHYAAGALRNLERRLEQEREALR